MLDTWSSLRAPGATSARHRDGSRKQCRWEAISTDPRLRSDELGAMGHRPGTPQAHDEDRFDWTSTSGGTPSAHTGPERAADGARYLYLEASAEGASEGGEAALRSAPMGVATGALLRFRYSLFGGNAGALKVCDTLRARACASLSVSRTVTPLTGKAAPDVRYIWGGRTGIHRH